MKKLFPWILVAVLAAWVLSALRPPPAKDGYDTAAFGRLPVLLNGRVQPLDSVGHNALLVMRTRQTVALEGGGRLSATEWLMEVLMKPATARERKVFRVDHPELRGLLKLPAEGPMYFSFKELQPQFEELEKQAARVGKIEVQVRTTFEKQVAKLHYSLTLFHRLLNSLQVEGTHDFAAQLEAYAKHAPAGLKAVLAQRAGQPHNAQDFERMVEYLTRFDFLANTAYPLLVPPPDPREQRDAWANVGNSLLGSAQTGEVAPAVQAYAAMAAAYHAGRVEAFNRAVRDYGVWLEGHLPKATRKGQSEFLYNQLQPFYKALVIYLLVFVLGCVSWFSWSQVLGRTALRLLWLGFIVHTAGIVFRMVLEGRPPVTNLYSSAVFVGWGAVLLGLFVERFYPFAIGTVMASAVGALTLIIAHNLSLDGDTMEMLRAVLDTNFWLATHVITITIGYSATFIAGFLAIMYIVLGLFTRKLTDVLSAALTRMVYGIVCFATLFSFTGTILGGIWADQSWGRFWGWDPKENGALIIVIWCAVILHARWGGLVAERGLMNLAIFGNIVTAFSWFGVNMLGVGLHSYGFMDQAFKWLMLFNATQVAFIALGCVPLRHWASFKAGPETPRRPARAAIAEA